MLRRGPGAWLVRRTEGVGHRSILSLATDMLEAQSRSATDSMKDVARDPEAEILPPRVLRIILRIL